MYLLSRRLHRGQVLFDVAPRRLRGADALLHAGDRARQFRQPRIEGRLRARNVGHSSSQAFGCRVEFLELDEKLEIRKHRKKC